MRYRSLDETLQRGPVRVLRAARHFDSISLRDLCELLEAYDKQSYDCIAAGLYTGVRRGLLEKIEHISQQHTHYRVTPKGLVWLAKQVTEKLEVASEKEIQKHDRDLERYGRCNRLGPRGVLEA